MPGGGGLGHGEVDVDGGDGVPTDAQGPDRDPALAGVASRAGQPRTGNGRSSMRPERAIGWAASTATPSSRVVQSSTSKPRTSSLIISAGRSVVPREPARWWPGGRARGGRLPAVIVSWGSPAGSGPPRSFSCACPSRYGPSGNPAEVITCSSRPLRAACCYFTPRWRSDSASVPLRAPATSCPLDDVGPNSRGSPTGISTDSADPQADVMAGVVPFVVRLLEEPCPSPPATLARSCSR